MDFDGLISVMNLDQLVSTMEPGRTILAVDNYKSILYN